MVETVKEFYDVDKNNIFSVEDAKELKNLSQKGQEKIKRQFLESIRTNINVYKVLDDIQAGGHVEGFSDQGITSEKIALLQYYLKNTDEKMASNKIDGNYNTLRRDYLKVEWKNDSTNWRKYLGDLADMNIKDIPNKKEIKTLEQLETICTQKTLNFLKKQPADSNDLTHVLSFFKEMGFKNQGKDFSKENIKAYLKKGDESGYLQKFVQNFISYKTPNEILKEYKIDIRLFDDNGSENRLTDVNITNDQRLAEMDKYDQFMSVGSYAYGTFYPSKESKNFKEDLDDVKMAVKESKIEEKIQEKPAEKVVSKKEFIKKSKKELIGSVQASSENIKQNDVYSQRKDLVNNIKTALESTDKKFIKTILDQLSGELAMIDFNKNSDGSFKTSQEQKRYNAAKLLHNKLDKRFYSLQSDKLETIGEYLAKDDKKKQEDQKEKEKEIAERKKQSKNREKEMENLFSLN